MNTSLRGASVTSDEANQKSISGLLRSLRSLAMTNDFLLKLFFFLLPWQTRWIFSSGTRAGLPWEWNTVAVTAAEALLWVAAIASLRGASRGSDVAISRLLRQSRHSFFAMTVGAIILLSIIVPRSTPVAILHAFDAILLVIILRRHSNPRQFIPYFIAGMIPAALLGPWQFWMQSTFASTVLGLAAHPVWQGGTSVVEAAGGRWLRAYGPFPHPNIFGGYLAVALVLAVARRDWTRFTAPLFASALVLTFSRSAWLAAGAGLVLVIARSVTTKQSRDLPVRQAGCFVSLAMTALASLVTISFVLPLVTTRATATGRLETKSITERSAAWHRAADTIRAHPLLGIGLGHGASQGEPVHNAFALAISEIGLIGLISLIGLMFLLVSKITQKITPEIITIFFLAIFDHYLWSLLPGLLLAASVIGRLRAPPD